MNSLRKFCITRRAGKWSVSSVDCVDVRLQVGGGNKPMFTLAALVRPLPTVGHLVLGQMAQLFETLATHFARIVVKFTLVWVFSSVNSFMGHQIALLVKILLAHLAMIFFGQWLLISDGSHFLCDILDQFVDIFWNNDKFRHWQSWLEYFLRDWFGLL